MRTIFLTALLAASLFAPGAALAKGHRTPMAQPVECHGNFVCLHPHYVLIAADRNTITTWWGGSKLVTTCVCRGRICTSSQQG